MAWTALRCCVVALLILVMLPNVDASTAKYESWFPLLSRRTYQEVSEGACNATLHQYRQALTGTNNYMKAATCAWQQNCILRELREDLKSRMASASVLLGLTPTLLASIGPSVVETAILSTQNPFLSLLISIGCPAVYPSRVLEYEDALDVLKIPPFTPLSDFHKYSLAIPVVFRTLKYLVLCGAAVNVFYTSWELGTKTVVSFRCTNYNLVIVWTSLSIIIHLFAANTFHSQYRYLSFAHLFKQEYHQISADQSSGDGLPQLGLTHRDSDLGADNDLDKQVKPTNRSIIFNYISTFLGYLHVLFGTMIFSSLLFIETIDAVTVILRYMTSTVVARAVLMYELDHLRRRHLKRQEQKVPRGRVQTLELQPSVPLKAYDTNYSSIPRKPMNASFYERSLAA